MLSLKLLTDALDTVSRMLARASGIQDRARERLVQDLQSICSKCEDGYIAVLAAMEPVRKALDDGTKLAGALDKFVADPELAKRFKPAQLCGEVDQLLVDLRNWLNPLRYAWAVGELDSLRDNLRQIDSLDSALNHTFYKFNTEVAGVARDLRAAKSEPDAAASRQYAGFLITGFMDDLRQAIQDVQAAKRRVIVGNDLKAAPVQ